MKLMIRHRILKFCRKVYAKFVRTPDWHIRPDEIDCDAQKASDKIYELLSSGRPCMIARYGSTEMAMLNNYMSIKFGSHSVIKFIRGEEYEWWWDESIMQQMRDWSGFFPVSKVYLGRFCEMMLEDTALLDVLGKWIRGESLMKAHLQNVFSCHLMHLEPFWAPKPWTRALSGKRIVVVHPFAETVCSQYMKNRQKLFLNKEILPEFGSLRTVKAVQSLGGGIGEFQDWFAALEWMKHEIDKEDYDICLIGCGAYGFPLAAHVKRSGKQAVHLGGALQLLFGIVGRRWEDPNYGVKEWDIPKGIYSRLVNEYWVRPGETDKPQNANQVEGSCYW